MSKQDSDGLGLGLSVPSSGRAGEPFWSRFPGLVGRYEPLLTSFRTSTGVRFDGQNHLSFDAAAAIQYPMTLFGWVRSSASAVMSLIAVGDVDVDNEYQSITMNASGNLRSTTRAGGAVVHGTSAATYNDGAYHFVSSACLAANRTLRVDDASAVVESSTQTIGATYDHTALGKRASSDSGLYFNGDLQHPGVYLGAFTQAQHDWLFNGGKGRRFEDVLNNPVGLNPLLFSGWWPCDEFSGTRMNWGYGLGGNAIHLTPAGNAAGLTFASADSEWAASASTPITTPGCSMCCSFKTTDNLPSVQQGLMTIGSSIANRQMLYIAANDELAIVSTATVTKFALSGVDCADQAWHFGGATVTESGGDAVSRTVYLDDETPVTNAETSTPDAAYTEFSIASSDSNGADNTFNGVMDNASFWSTPITAAQYTWLRTGGLTGGPATYQDILLSSHPDNPGVGNLAAFYTCNEATGASTLVNVHNPGTYDLTTSSGGSGPTSAPGVVVDLPLAVDGVVENLPGVEDRALEFDGTQYGSASGTAITAYPVSYSCWVKRDGNPPSTEYLIVAGEGNDNFLAVRIHTTGVAQAVVKQGGGGEVSKSSTNICDGDLHHLVLVATAATIGIAVDGGTLATAVNSHSFPSNVDKLAVGGWLTGALKLDGVLDEVGIWDGTAFSADNITTLYNSSAGRLHDDDDLPSGATTYYPLNSNHADGEGKDVIGSLDLTLNNGPTDAPGIPAGQSAGNGGVISEWRNQQADNNHLTQVTFAARSRTVAVDDGTGYALESDGADDNMFATLASPITGAHTVYAVFEYLASGTDLGLIRLATSAVQQGLAIHQNRLYSYHGSGSQWRQSGTLTAGTKYLAVRRWTGGAAAGDMQLWVNGIEATSVGGTPSATGLGTDLGIFSRTDALGFLASRKRVCIVADVAHSDEEVSEITQHLASQYGITLG